MYLWCKLYTKLCWAQNVAHSAQGHILLFYETTFPEAHSRNVKEVSALTSIITHHLNKSTRGGAKCNSGYLLELLEFFVHLYLRFPFVIP